MSYHQVSVMWWSGWMMLGFPLRWFAVRRAENVWGYLRTSLSCAGRLDLLPAVEAQDLGALQKELSLS